MLKSHTFQTSLSRLHSASRRMLKWTERVRWVSTDLAQARLETPHTFAYTASGHMDFGRANWSRDRKGMVTMLILEQHRRSHQRDSWGLPVSSRQLRIMTIYSRLWLIGQLRQTNGRPTGQPKQESGRKLQPKRFISQIYREEITTFV